MKVVARDDMQPSYLAWMGQGRDCVCGGWARWKEEDNLI